MGLMVSRSIIGLSCRMAKHRSRHEGESMSCTWGIYANAYVHVHVHVHVLPRVYIIGVHTWHIIYIRFVHLEHMRGVHLGCML